MFDFIQDPEFLNTEGDHQHDNSVSSCSSKFEGELNFSKLQQYIRGLIGDQISTEARAAWNIGKEFALWLWAP